MPYYYTVSSVSAPHSVRVNRRSRGVVFNARKSLLRPELSVLFGDFTVSHFEFRYRWKNIALISIGLVELAIVSQSSRFGAFSFINLICINFVLMKSILITGLAPCLHTWMLFLCYATVWTDSYDSKEVILGWWDQEPIELHKTELQLPQFEMLNHVAEHCTETYKTGAHKILVG